jgi:hypothetical protein
MYFNIRPPCGTRTTAPIALSLALFFALAAGCGTGSNSSNSPVSVDSNNAPPPVNLPSSANTPSPTAKPAGLSPTEAVRGYYVAGIRNDVAGVKRFMSRASLQMMEEVAKREGKTLEQLFGEAAKREAGKPPPVFGNERIVGDTATVDIETPGQPALTMPLIKEDGQWKLAFGKPKSGATKH